MARIPAYPELLDKDTLQSLVDEHGSLNAVARHLECARETVQRWAKYHGVSGAVPSGIEGTTNGNTRPAVALDEQLPRIHVEKDGNVEVFFVSGAVYRLSLDDKRRIYELYSNDGSGVQIAEIERGFGIPRSAFDAIKNYWGLTHASMVWPDEDISVQEPGQLIESQLAKKKGQLYRRFKAEEDSFYKSEYEKLLRRSRLEDRLIDEVNGKLQAFEPSDFRLHPRSRPSTENRRLYFGLTDWHRGKRTDASLLVASNATDKEELESRILRLKHGLMDIKDDDNHGFDELIIMCHGDLLDDPDAMTYPRQDRSQDLHDVDQVMATVNILHDFFLFCSKLFPKVSIYSVAGNHGGTWDTIAVTWAAERLRDIGHVSVEVSKKPLIAIERGRNQFIALHGNELRHGKVTREMDVMQAIMMAGKPNLRHYITFGHLHHRQSLDNLMKEGTGYEWFLFPSLVGGDEYSEGRFFATSRPAQTVLVVDDNEGVLYPRTIYCDSDGGNSVDGKAA